jgi:hypothetical protein
VEDVLDEETLVGGHAEERALVGFVEGFGEVGQGGFDDGGEGFEALDGVDLADDPAEPGGGGQY